MTNTTQMLEKVFNNFSIQNTTQHIFSLSLIVTNDSEYLKIWNVQKDDDVTHPNHTLIDGISYENNNNNKNYNSVEYWTRFNDSQQIKKNVSLVPRISTEIPIWLIPCYNIILVFAIVGNLLVASTLAQNRRMRTITNVFLLNLAISDMLLGVLCMPITLVGTYLRHFIFGEFVCKFIQFAQATSVAVSSWTLVAISCERYYAICHPLRSRTWQTINHAYKIIATIWCGSMICMTPIALFSQLIPTSRQGFRKCREQWPPHTAAYERFYNIFLDVILLVLPLAILCAAYTLITRTLCRGIKDERNLIYGNQAKTQKVVASLGRNPITSTFYTSFNSASYRCRLWKSHITNRNVAVYVPNQIETVLEKNDQIREKDNAQNVQWMNSSADQIAVKINNTENNYSHETEMHDFCDKLEFKMVHKELQQNVILQESSCSTSNLEPVDCSLSNTPMSSPGFEDKASTSCETKYMFPMKSLRVEQLHNIAEGKENKRKFQTVDIIALPLKIGCEKESTHLQQQMAEQSTMRQQIKSQCQGINKSGDVCQQQHKHKHKQKRRKQQQQHKTSFMQLNNFEKRNVYNASSLRISGSTLRRSNLAKNLESKKRVIRMLFVVVLEFFICWTPLYVVNTAAIFIGPSIYEYVDYTTISFLQLLAYSSSCCNPITYCFMNASFRRAFMDTFKDVHFCKRRTQTGGGMNPSMNDNSSTMIVTEPHTLRT